jgi:hypothetical protein
MPGKRPLIAVSCALVCCALLGSLSSVAQADEARRPNVLLIITDDND